MLATRHEVPKQNQEEVQDLGIGFADKVSAVAFATMFASVPFLWKWGASVSPRKLVNMILGGCNAEEN